MRLTGIDHGVEITTLADIPSEGASLGSSNSITVALLLALHTYRGESPTAARLTLRDDRKVPVGQERDGAKVILKVRQ